MKRSEYLFLEYTAQVQGLKSIKTVEIITQPGSVGPDNIALYTRSVAAPAVFFDYSKILLRLGYNTNCVLLTRDLIP